MRASDLFWARHFASVFNSTARAVIMAFVLRLVWHDFIRVVLFCIELYMSSPFFHVQVKSVRQVMFLVRLRGLKCSGNRNTSRLKDCKI